MNQSVLMQNKNQEIMFFEWKTHLKRSIHTWIETQTDEIGVFRLLFINDQVSLNPHFPYHIPLLQNLYTNDKKSIPFDQKKTRGQTLPKTAISRKSRQVDKGKKYQNT